VRFIDEYRDPAAARAIVASIRDHSRTPLRIMEFCGGHTHAIMRHGIRQVLPPTVELLSGPGCPVCVTSNREIDHAIALANEPGVIVATFGDMIRVPGSRSSLQEAKAEGADARIVYSTLDALKLARENPGSSVVFLGIGFETTAPTVAASLLQAESEGLPNYYVFSTHKLTPPATRAILDAGEVRLSGILGPGHVTTIIGARAWEFLPREYGLPCAVAGFEPLDILRAIDSLVAMVEERRPAVDNVYGRAVQPEGNVVAQRMMERVFRVAEAEWRGLGSVPSSGLAIQAEFAHRDAALAFPVEINEPVEHPGCRCGDVLRGTLSPPDCPLFGRACTPARPIGPCMVSAEGACAAYHEYGGLLA
jgi:hydrogenase expression/formation protein HypD